MPENEQLYYGGTVYTVEPDQPYAEAVAVRDGIIITAGSESECRSSLSASFELIDLKGGTLLPGFFDCHVHPLATIFYSMNVNLHGIAGIDELVTRLSESDRKYPDKPWVIGLNFDEQGMTEPRLPDKTDLDRVSADKPVIIMKHDGHSLITNSRALEKAGITPETPDPDGGNIDRDSRGDPNGIFRETAVQLILNIMPLPNQDEIIDGARKTFNTMLGYGITSIGVILQTSSEGPEGGLGAFDIPLMKMLLGQIPQSIYAFILTRNPESISGFMEPPLHDPSTGSRSRIGGLKIISDGTFGSCTAAMHKPFSDNADKSGFMLLENEKMYKLMASAHNTGLQLAVHAIGDAANQTVIDLYGRLLKEYPRTDHRHRIEHASILDDKMLSEVKRLGLVLSMQPMFIDSEKHWLEKRIGIERMNITYPFNSIYSSGIKVAGSSDSPVESQHVLHAIECCVTRKGLVPSQGISVEDAIRMFTINAAYAQFEEKIKGSIAPGKRADMVLLEKNPLEVSPDELKKIQVIKTVIGGKAVYNN